VALSRWDYDFEKATMLNCQPGASTAGLCTEHTLDFVMLEGHQSSNTTAGKITLMLPSQKIVFGLKKRSFLRKNLMQEKSTSLNKTACTEIKPPDLLSNISYFHKAYDRIYYMKIDQLDTVCK